MWHLVHLHHLDPKPPPRPPPRAASTATAPDLGAAAPAALVLPLGFFAVRQSAVASAKAREEAQALEAKKKREAESKKNLPVVAGAG